MVSRYRDAVICHDLDALWRELRLHAVRRGTTAAVREAVEQYLGRGTVVASAPSDDPFDKHVGSRIFATAACARFLRPSARPPSIRRA